MESCNRGHEEVVFVGGRYSPCPACAAIEAAAEEIQKLKDEISSHVCGE